MHMNPVQVGSQPVSRRHMAPDAPAVPGGARAAPSSADRPQQLPTDRDFALMRAAFRSSGGTARGDDLARMMEDLHRVDYVSLARLVASAEVFGFEFRGSYWIPMFQFDLRNLSIRPGPQQVLAELAAEFDGWALATWFAQPNCWLDGAVPVDLLDSNLAAVLVAARTDRFIAVG